MTDQEILKGAPKGATHYECGEYMRNICDDEWEYWSKAGGWQDTHPESETRSLTDIRRIVELEEELTELKAYKSKLLAHVKYSSTQEEVEIIKLEQQAKGVNDFKEWVLDTDKNSSGLDVRDTGLIEFYVESLISQAKALKEQVKL